jgi:hypothetical protein
VTPITGRTTTAATMALLAATTIAWVVPGSIPATREAVMTVLLMETAVICPDPWEIVGTTGLLRTEAGATRTTEWALLVAILEASGTGGALFILAAGIDGGTLETFHSRMSHRCIGCDTSGGYISVMVCWILGFFFLADCARC